jgi:protein-S-isoprenylcysteine O-methyltransferase Ste14
MATSATTVSAARFSGPRLLALGQDVLLLSVAAFFLVLHVMRLMDGHLTSIPFALEQMILVVLFLTRRRSQATSTRPLDWVVAIGGWLTLAMRPHDSGAASLAVAGTAIQLAGLALACIAFSFLGRSFGVVAANRGLKVNGPYRIVRHPVYFAHFVTSTGFVIANFSPLNILILGAVAFCQVMRIRAEERVLTESGDYAVYAARVRWRLIPGLY